MARKIPRWVKGCAIGCGAVILVVIVLIAGGFFFVRDAVQEFETADTTMETLAERFGSVQEYHPDPRGAIGPERMEAFLAVRDSLARAREETEESLTVLSEDGNALRKAAAGFTLTGQLAGFVIRRNEALMEADMGLGEYTYVYALAYYSWLGESPADGPSWRLVGDSGYILDNIEKIPEAEVREHRTDVTRRSLNGLLLPVLRNQLADLETGADTGDFGAWRQALAAEVAALEADSHRLPWEDGLPVVIVSSIEPYRDRLAASYSVMCNALEMGIARR